MKERELKRIWIDFQHGDDNQFWKAQWDMHGSCFYENFNQEAYFQMAIDLYQEVELVRVLMSQNIDPIYEQDFELEDLKNKLRDALGGVRVQIRCTTPTDQNDRPLPNEIEEIRVCYDPVGNQRVDCEDPDIGCGKIVKWFI